MTKKWLVWSLLIIAGLLQGCREDGNASPPDPVVLSYISISPSSISLQEGTGYQLTATAYYSDGGSVDITNSASWYSSSTYYATVTSSGYMNAVNAGSTYININYSGKSDSTWVNVSAAPAPDPVVISTFLSSDNERIVGIGSTVQLYVKEKLDTGWTVTVTSGVVWESLDPGIATVDANGVITAVAMGTATINATYNSVVYPATVTVVADSLTLSVNGAASTTWTEVSAANSEGFDPIAKSYWDLKGIDYDGRATNMMTYRFGKTYNSGAGDFDTRLTIQIPSWDKTFGPARYSLRHDMVVEYVGPEGTFVSDYGKQTSAQLDVTVYSSTAGDLNEGNFVVKLCKKTVLDAGGDCSLGGNNITLSGSFFATHENSPEYINSEGTAAAPAALTYTTDFTYNGTVTSNGDSYYAVSGLTAGETYVFSFTNVTSYTNFYIFDDAAMTVSLGLGTGEGTHLAATPSGNTIYIQVNEYSGPTSINGSMFDITVSHAPSEGTLASPKTIAYGTETPYSGTVSTVESYYAITGVTPGTNYTIQTKGGYRNPYIYVYDDSAFSTQLCSGGILNGPSYCSTESSLTSTTLYVKVSSAKGEKFELLVRENIVAEGTKPSPVNITSIMPYNGTKSYKGTLTKASYYVVNGLAAGQPYEITFAHDEYNTEMYPYSDTAFSVDETCSTVSASADSSKKYHSRCIIIPTNSDLYIMVDYDVMSSSTSPGDEFILNVAPLTATNITSSLPYDGALLEAGDNVYQIDGLSPGVVHYLSLSNITVDANARLYSSSDFTTNHCYITARESEAMICQFTPTDSTVYLSLNTDSYNSEQAGTYTVNSITTTAPADLGASLPYSGSVSNNSVYSISGLTAYYNYTISLTNLDGDADLAVYSDAELTDQLCVSRNTGTADESCRVFVGSYPIYIRVYTSSGPVNYQLNAVQ